MFVDAIEKAALFTRPIHTISRNYGSSVVHPGAATLFFVNADGWALTCAHVAKQFIMSEQIAEKYNKFKDEYSSGKGKIKEKKLRRELEKKYQYSKQITVELKGRFMNCIEGTLNVEGKLHEKYDVALLKFDGYNKLLCDNFPIFAKDTSGLKQGKSLCRLGYPFPEFTNFTYNESKDTIEWTETGKKNTPKFPIDGMLTRRLRDESGEMFGFEMSTPGLRGQSGGPAFDMDDKIWGMQSATGHLDLNFDIDQNVIRNGLPKNVKNSSFLHVGHCINVDILKSFMRAHNVDFKEE